MKYFGSGLSEKHKELAKIIRKEDMLTSSKKLFNEIHTALHMSESSCGLANEVDLLFNDLLPFEYAIMSASKDETIAWTIWHIARIEDLTLNILVANSEQIFNLEWKERLNAVCSDTGNALTDDEIMLLSKNINTAELLAYRSAVGKRTREIVDSLTINDIRRKVSQCGLDKIKSDGGVTKDSEWLLDYWGQKDVAGILLMPPTRHVMLHLNDCCKLKLQIRTRKRFYSS